MKVEAELEVIKVGDFVKRSDENYKISETENCNKVVEIKDGVAKLVLNSGCFIDYKLKLLEKLPKLTKGEKDLFFWQFNKAGSFKSKLFDLLCVADSYNMELLNKSFPEHVKAYKNYINVEGYWNNLKDRM